MKNRIVERGCLMLRIDPDLGSHIVKLGKTSIPPEILYTDPNDPSYGYEEEPHVTVKYGFTKDLSKKDLAKILKDVKPFNITLKSLSQFKNEKFDVVKFDVDGENEILKELRKRCDEFPNDDKYPTYHPHMTLGYVKKDKFLLTKDGLNISIPVTGFKYSGPNGKFYINL